MAQLKSGTYQVIAQGYEGNTTPYEVVIKDDKITAINPQKNIIADSLEDTVIKRLTKQMIDEQTLDVDAISGATSTSKGLVKAVGDVITEAGGNVADFHYSAANKGTADEQPSVKADLSQNDYSEWRAVPEKIDQEMETDFLIIGAGISGLAAAVQAAELGLKTTVLEKMPFVAGNGGGVEGIFGINTKMQKAAGIHANKEEIIAREAELGQYRVDGSFWVDLVNNSADNIDWLVDHGVQLTSVDDYHGTCQFPTFHWYKGGFASVGYVPYMKKCADDLGVEFLLETSAQALIYEDGKVRGAYAKNKDKVLKIKAKATLIATGGVGHSEELIAKQGWQTENLHYCSMPSNTGDGYKMAMSLGAKDMLLESPEFMMNYIMALPHEGVHLYIDPINGFMALPSGGPVVWVNQEGVRLVNENVKKYNLLYQRMAIQSTKNTYQIFNQAIYDQITEGIENAGEILQEAVRTNDGDSLYKEDRIEDLAQHFNLPKETFIDTMKRYNSYCHQGKDEEFNKDADMLIPIEEGPFYIARLDPSNLIGIGGVGSNRKFEVIDEHFDRIPGLYISGMDSTMQYRSVYTITLGGSACAHNVNSGRHAAMNAKDYISKEL